MKTSNPRSRLVVVLASSLLILLAACGGGDDDDETTVDSAALGEQNEATGDTLKVGFIWDGVLEGVAPVDQGVMAAATVKHINGYLGGVAGHELELDVCETKGTADGAQACVAQFAKSEVPLAVSGVTSQDAVLFPALAQAGIPVFAFTSLAQANLSTPGIFVMSNGILVLAAPAQLAAENDVTDAAIIVIDVPAASGQIDALTDFFYKPQGVSTDILKVAPGTPDITPQVQVAMEKDPGLVSIVGDNNLSVTALKALAASGYEGQIVVLSGQITPDAAKELTNLEGAFAYTSTNEDPATEEAKTYQAVMDTWAPDLAETSVPYTYQALVGLARALDGYTGEMDSAGISEALKTMKEVPMPLAEGLTFRCGHEPISIAPNICAKTVLRATLDAEGLETDFQPVDGTELLDIG